MTELNNDELAIGQVQPLEIILSKKRNIEMNDDNIEDKEIRIKELNIKIANACNHEFIDDYIDTMFPYREGILITYCKYCELSKSYVESNKNN